VTSAGRTVVVRLLRTWLFGTLAKGARELLPSACSAVAERHPSSISAEPGPRRSWRLVHRTSDLSTRSAERCTSMRPRTLLLAAATTLVLAACGGGEEAVLDQDDAAPPAEDADEAVTDTEDGDPDAATEDDEDRAQLDTDDTTVDAGTGSLPEQWPEELALPDVDDREINIANFVEMDGQGVIQANVTFPGELDDARGYFESLEGAGFEVEITEDLDAALPRIDAEVEGNGWEGTLIAQDGPNIIVDYQLTSR